MNEYETSDGKACFLTLTYSEENLPVDNSIHKDELQRFFKRLRKKLGEHKIKYYACGEYGDKYKRPHYHAIVFNLSVMDAMILLPDCWKLGFFTIQPVYYESCAYVTGYVMKKYNGEKAKEVYGDKEVPFRLCSLGLGKQYALDNRDDIISHNGIFINGVNKGFPKYYQRKFIEEDIKNLADTYTEKDLDFNNFHSAIDDLKANSFLHHIKIKAIERDNLEKQKYDEWLKTSNPDYIVDNYIQTPFEQWKKSVNKLRDLTVKAKNKLHEEKKKL